jgi:riboflavin synthase
MFTGLIEAMGEVVDAQRTPNGVRLRLKTELAPQLAPGDSLAVSGVCLTVTLSEKGMVYADIGPETARITTLGNLQRGRPVNLERSMRADARIGGHFVQGHVDGMGTVEDIRHEADAHWVSIAFPHDLAPFFIRKGSVAVDGISLTVAGLGDGRFDVMIIPFTWDQTAIRFLKVHDRVNLECDMIGKYVARAIELSGIETGRARIKAH